MNEEDKRIWRKDDYFEISGKRIDMDPNVVSFSSEPLPVAWQFQHETQLGQATNIELRDGEIFCEIEFFEGRDVEMMQTLWKNHDVRLGGYYFDVMYSDETKKQVGSCTLKAVSFCLEEAMPGASIDG